jgi:hypothetical protein
MRTKRIQKEGIKYVDKGSHSPSQRLVVSFQDLSEYELNIFL